MSEMFGIDMAPAPTPCATHASRSRGARRGDLLYTLEHLNPSRYADQRIFVIPARGLRVQSRRSSSAALVE